MQLGMVAIYPNQFWRGEAEGASEDEKVEYEQHILNSNIKYNNAIILNLLRRWSFFKCLSQL